MEDPTASNIVGEFWRALCKRGGDCLEPEVLWQFLENEPSLSAERRQALAGHIAQCGHCTSELGRLYKAIEWRDAHRQEAVAEILRVVRGEAGEPPRWAPARPQDGPKSKPLLKYLQVAACILVLVSAAFAVGCKMGDLYDYFSSRALRAFWEALPSTTDLVVGEAEVFIDGQPHYDYIGLGDVEAVSALYQYLAESKPLASKVRLRTSRELEAVGNLPRDSGLVLVGGPSVNTFALEILATIYGVDPQDERALEQGFRFVGAEHVVPNAFVRATTNGSLGIEDVENGDLFPWDPHSGKTCALLVRATINDYRGRDVEVVIAAGFDGAGTATSALILTHLQYSDLLTELDQAWRDSKAGVMVVAANADGQIERYRCVAVGQQRR